MGMRTQLIGTAGLALWFMACGGGTTGGGGSHNPGGGGPSCGVCDPGFVCQGTDCLLDPSGLWVLAITSGSIAEKNPNGDSWDAFGGLPDPYVCGTINGDRRCSSVKQDTLSPVWNESFPAVTATALLAGVTVEIWDKDVSVDDPICGAGVVPVTIDNFKTNRWGAGCSSGRFSATLNKQ